MRKTKGKVTILIIVIILILYIFIFQNKENQNNIFQDDLIFFKFFSYMRKEENNILTTTQMNASTPIYSFNVYYKNTDFKKIYLADTISKDTLIYGKVAPRNKRRI